PTCTRFAFQRGGATFLGASPETLVTLADGRARADALAGTTARFDDDVRDARARAALLASDKDLREHRAVVEAVVAVLAPLARAVRANQAPTLKTLRNVHHLHTPIEADLDDAAHVLDLVARLHPTPAVAGAPRERALAWLAEHELDSRGWYAGPVGWFDARGEGAFSVALRAGVVSGARAWLYAGAGIVAGSDPRAEYAETRAKHAPMLAALEVTP
ncbi:MAG TPA: isochorismate synthase, partial [Byssovorax sp.]